MKGNPTTLTNPMIPFTGSLPGGYLQAGTLIIIQGEPTPCPNRFTISLLCGPQPERANVAFQLAAQFDTSWVTRNSRINKEWGEEEGAMPCRFPFFSQKQFSIEIFASNAAYFVAVDGKHFCEFQHRVPLVGADTLQIQGSVRLSRLEFRITDVYPAFPSHIDSKPDSFDISHPVLPFTSRLGDQLAVGEEVQVYGRVKPFPNRFHVNLQQGVQVHPHAIIPFHFNPRFEGGERTVVMNSWINSWGKEVISPSPLKPDANFLLIIKRREQYYEVILNSDHFASYPHRISPDIVDSISISGDVIVSRVAVV